MCGFVGFTGDLYNLEEQKMILGKMLHEISHRGPDGEGFFCDSEFAVGFRRLRIIDVSTNGDQPMLNEDGSIVLVFNGEIYNFQELKDHLIVLGHKFRSQTDSEVLIHGYEEFKEELFPKLRGMFGLAIWDRKEKKLLLVRDIFGIKPLYYYLTRDAELLFGSEIKGFLPCPLFKKKMNEKAIKPYMTFQYPVTNETFFKGVFKLLPGTYLVWQAGKLTTKAYFNHIFSEKGVNKRIAVEKVRKAIKDSVQMHKVSDVPIGVAVSGGVDSSYIAAEAQSQSMFSVGFRDVNFDETGYAKELASLIGSKIYIEYVEPQECFEKFGDIQYHLDEPSANPSVLPLFFLTKLISQHVKVVLSGEGADELFGGYEAYLVPRKMRWYRRLVPQCLRNLLAKFAELVLKGTVKTKLIRGAKTEQEDFIGQAYIFTEKESTALLRAGYDFEFLATDLTNKYYVQTEGNDLLTQKIYLDLNLWLPNDILLKADKMSMAHSVELRTPFLDIEVLKVASEIPSKFKVRRGVSKYVLREASLRKLPSTWATRPKKGFPVPIANWLRDKVFYEQVKDFFVSRVATQFFENSKILKLLEDHYTGKSNNARKIWTIYSFLVWYDQYFIKR
ncbi:MAG: asparagine synthase (glutamine-hydrolyzing) [Oscillospiraceae bacterium]|nr:asparagine synthase (glutamine-hydrolyzing) [Oscillospiraceae bacterium]